MGGRNRWMKEGRKGRLEGREMARGSDECLEEDKADERLKAKRER